MNTFEFDGEKYKKASKHQKEWGNSLISELSLNGNEQILDLGCGDGSLTEQLAQLVPNGKDIYYIFSLTYSVDNNIDGFPKYKEFKDIYAVKDFIEQSLNEN